MEEEGCSPSGRLAHLRKGEKGRVKKITTLKVSVVGEDGDVVLEIIKIGGKRMRNGTVGGGGSKVDSSIEQGVNSRSGGGRKKGECRVVQNRQRGKQSHPLKRVPATERKNEKQRR